MRVLSDTLRLYNQRLIVFFLFQIATFAKGYAERGMLAYVAGVQRKEREAGVDVLQHQVCYGILCSSFKFIVSITVFF